MSEEFQSKLDLIKDLYEDSLMVFNIKVVDVKPDIVNKHNKQMSEEETKIDCLEDVEYCSQRNPYEDCYIGKIARKVKGKELWVVFDYEC